MTGTDAISSGKRAMSYMLNWTVNEKDGFEHISLTPPEPVSGWDGGDELQKHFRSHIVPQMEEMLDDPYVSPSGLTTIPFDAKKHHFVQDRKTQNKLAGSLSCGGANQTSLVSQVCCSALRT